MAFVGHWFLCISASPQTIHIACSHVVAHVLAEPQQVAVHLFAAMFWPPSKTSAGCCPSRFYVGYLCWAQQLAALFVTGFFAVQPRLTHIACSQVCGSSTRLPPCKDVWPNMPAPDICAIAIACFAGCHMLGGSVSLIKLLPTCLQPCPHCHCLFCRLPYVWRPSVTHQVAAHLPAAMSLLPSPGFILDTCVRRTVSICWPLVPLQFSLAPNHTHCLQRLWLMFLPNLSRSLFTCSQLCFAHPPKPQQVAVHLDFMLDTCVGTAVNIC